MAYYNYLTKLSALSLPCLRRLLWPPCFPGPLITRGSLVTRHLTTWKNTIENQVIKGVHGLYSPKDQCWVDVSCVYICVPKALGCEFYKAATTQILDLWVHWFYVSSFLDDGSPFKKDRAVLTVKHGICSEQHDNWLLSFRTPTQFFYWTLF